MEDGSGLSRYDYVTASALVQILTHVWRDETLRGPFVAALPVGAHDGTLESHMRNSPLDRRVQAKTGTITNVRALSGYMETDAGEKLAFSMIANNTTAPGAEVDAVMEKALVRLLAIPAAH
jgi:D-alanyl-D-alanine carboxypeptidase/D-alanyl-D-alanine-endopeptidase (penicillin-binding protein 4)